MVKKVLLFISLFLVSCSTNSGKKISNDNFFKLIKNNKCEEALINMPFRINENQTKLKIKKGAGVLLSAVTTATFALTLDMIVLMGTCSRHGCILNEEAYFAMTKDSWRITEPYRCPDIGLLSKSLISISKCYSNRLDTENLKYAKGLLNEIVSHKKYYSCLRDKYKKQIKSEYNKISLLEKSKKYK